MGRFIGPCVALRPGGGCVRIQDAGASKFWPRGISRAPKPRPRRSEVSDAMGATRSVASVRCRVGRLVPRPSCTLCEA